MTDIGTALIEAAALVGSTWLATELLYRAISRGAKRSGASPLLIRTVRRALRILWIALTTAGVVDIAGFSQYSLVAFSGVAGLAVSLALQNTLSNIISGILMMSDGILRLHDMVEYSGVKGEVVKVGLRATWVRNAEGDIAIISNNYLANGPLINHTASQRLHRKL
ncbi:MAG TPA: mechanosensitive ion channel domain-containing protein [Candidatus Bathyarchaeia archaeon]|nr:mechanosensitive ion channel domain-containing protein [Candidatus Bathyarchaeia archaeon]